jgi:hypothetical protein
MNELVQLATILEERIKLELDTQVKSSYRAMLKMSARDDGTLAAPDLDKLVDRYLTLYIAGERNYSVPEEIFQDHEKYMSASTLDWPATKQWIRDTEKVAIKHHSHCDNGECATDLGTATSIVEDVVKQYGAFNEGECKRLKDTLLKMEDGSKTGRVSLADFYKEGISGTWQFNEKADYLRHLGVLDESIAGQPRVIVTNYVSSWVNCLSSSDMYSVCCRNECEDILGQLEHRVGNSAASPESILFSLPSHISRKLQSRLHSIAKTHNGEVPLHSRAFAQWLHLAFPHSCPHPHKAGTYVTPLTPDEWMKETGNTEIKASHEEILMAIGATGYEYNDKSGNAKVQWSESQDVQVIHQPALNQDRRNPHLDCGVMVMEFGGCIALLLIVLHTAGKLRKDRKVNMKLGFEKVAI